MSPTAIVGIDISSTLIIGNYVILGVQVVSTWFTLEPAKYPIVIS